MPNEVVNGVATTIPITPATRVGEQRAHDEVPATNRGRHHEFHRWTRTPRYDRSACKISAVLSRSPSKYSCSTSPQWMRSRRDAAEFRTKNTLSLSPIGDHAWLSLLSFGSEKLVLVCLDPLCRQLLRAAWSLNIFRLILSKDVRSSELQVIGPFILPTFVQRLLCLCVHLVVDT